MSTIIKFPGRKDQIAELSQRVEKLKNHIDKLILDLQNARSALTQVESNLSKLKIKSQFQLIKLKKDK